MKDNFRDWLTGLGPYHHGHAPARWWCFIVGHDPLWWTPHCRNCDAWLPGAHKQAAKDIPLGETLPGPKRIRQRPPAKTSLTPWNRG